MIVEEHRHWWVKVWVKGVIVFESVNNFTFLTVITNAGDCMTYNMPNTHNMRYTCAPGFSHGGCINHTSYALIEGSFSRMQWRALCAWWACASSPQIIALTRHCGVRRH